MADDKEESEKSELAFLVFRDGDGGGRGGTVARSVSGSHRDSIGPSVSGTIPRGHQTRREIAGDLNVARGGRLVAGDRGDPRERSSIAIIGNRGGNRDWGHFVVGRRENIGIDGQALDDRRSVVVNGQGDIARSAVPCGVSDSNCDRI